MRFIYTWLTAADCFLFNLSEYQFQPFLSYEVLGMEPKLNFVTFYNMSGTFQFHFNIIAKSSA